MAIKISDIINNAILANESDTKLDRELVNDFIKSIRVNVDLFKKSEEIDINNNNGFNIDFNVIDTLASRYENKEVLIKNNNEIFKSNELLTSSVYEKLGIVLVYFDGNPYTLIEMIFLGLLTHNTIIFNYNGYMRGVNGLIISLVESVLEKETINKNKFQLIEEIDNKDILNNYVTIDKVLFIGVPELESKIPTKVLGYGSYDLYVESLDHKNVIERILKTGLDINLYLLEELRCDYENATIVGDIDEAISRINSEGKRYCSAIFSNNADNGSKFLNEVKSNTVMYNVSPTLERALNLSQEDLLKKKNIVLPDNLKFDGKRIEL